MILRRLFFPAPLPVAAAALLLWCGGCTPPQTVQEDVPGPAEPAIVREAAFDPAVYEPMSLRAQSTRIPVIMYHDIIAERGPKSVYFDCTRDEFEKQMQWLVERGAQPISAEQLHRHLARGEAVPDKAIVLSFDDNYQGFYDNAYPILKQYNFPAIMFVHTNYVGDKTSDHPKMDWATLRSLADEGLVTIGSHTMSHPEDMRKLTVEQQEKELTGSREILERELGRKITYLAYPVGNADAVTLDLAQRAGYTLAFTITNGAAEESPGILAVNRYIHTRLEKAWEDAEAARENVPAAVVEQELKASPVEMQVSRFEGVKLGLIRGGAPHTRRTGGRKSVGEFIQEAQGVAGINGTFFADAALKGTDNTMIGPCQTQSEGVFLPEMASWRLPRLLDRPFVILGPNRIAIVPFQPGYMNASETVRALMPDYTDVFVAGAWIVHEGTARTDEQMRAYAVQDFHQMRRRAFFGIDEEGRVVLGASLQVVGTERLAKAAAAAGVREAVLLDSGFSTSLIFDNRILVTGHTAEHLPSRPVPHAIVLTGTLQQPTDPEQKKILSRANPAVEPAARAKSAAAPDHAGT